MCLPRSKVVGDAVMNKVHRSLPSWSLHTGEEDETNEVHRMRTDE